jgi:hypothetical protein
LYHLQLVWTGNGHKDCFSNVTWGDIGRVVFCIEYSHAADRCNRLNIKTGQSAGG